MRRATVVFAPDLALPLKCRRLEHEIKLQQHLRARGIPFMSEEELRDRGDAKTPDALLSVPVLVCGRQVTRPSAARSAPSRPRGAPCSQHIRPDRCTGSTRRPLLAASTSTPSTTAHSTPDTSTGDASTSALARVYAVSSPPDARRERARRYEAGLVIYWFGFDADAYTDPMVMLLDDFPASEIELLAAPLVAKEVEAVEPERARARTAR